MESKQLSLRILNVQDEQLVQLFFAYPLTHTQRLIFLNRSITKNESIFGIFLDDVCIGYIQMYHVQDETCEIGYRLWKEYRDQGYMSQAISLWMGYIPSGINTIYAYVKKDNITSMRVLENNGFQCVEERDDVLKYEKKR